MQDENIDKLKVITTASKNRFYGKILQAGHM
jgi:hypothetical protein